MVRDGCELMCVMRLEPGSFAKATSAFNHGAVSPAPAANIFDNYYELLREYVLYWRHKY